MLVLLLILLLIVIGTVGIIVGLIKLDTNEPLTLDEQGNIVPDLTHR